jgi:hypothetical protein
MARKLRVGEGGSIHQVLKRGERGSRSAKAQLISAGVFVPLAASK